MKLTKKRVNITKTKGVTLSPLASLKLMNTTKFNIKLKVLYNLIERYGESIISYHQLCDLISALEQVIQRHEDKIKNKNGGKNAYQQR